MRQGTGNDNGFSFTDPGEDGGAGFYVPPRPVDPAAETQRAQDDMRARDAAKRRAAFAEQPTTEWHRPSEQEPEQAEAPREPGAQAPEGMPSPVAPALADPPAGYAKPSVFDNIGFFVSRHKPIVIAAAAAVAAAAVFAAVLMNAPADQAAEPEQQSQAEEQSDEQAQPVQRDYKLDFKTTADGWDANTSSPLIVRITGATEDNKAVDTYRVVPASGETSIDIAAGAYSVQAISPINADGSIYDVPAARTFTFNQQTDVEQIAQIDLALVAPADASKDAVDKVLAQVQTAINSVANDKSAGELSTSGQRIAELAAANAAANPNEQAAAAAASAASTDQGGTASAASGDVPLTTGMPSDDVAQGAGQGQDQAAGSAGVADDGSDDAQPASPSEGGQYVGTAVTAGVASAQDSGSGADDTSIPTTDAQSQGDERTWHDPVYGTVHHDAVTKQVQKQDGTYETVIVVPAYDSYEVVQDGGWW